MSNTSLRSSLSSLINVSQLIDHGHVCVLSCMSALSFVSLHMLVYDMVDISGDIMFGFLILLGFNILFAIVASFLVTLEVKCCRHIATCVPTVYLSHDSIHH